MNVIQKTVLAVGLAVGLCASSLAQTNSGTIGVAGLGPTLPARALLGLTGFPNTYTNLIVTNTIAPQTTNSVTGGTLLSQPYLIVPGYDMGFEITMLGTNRSDQLSNFVTSVNTTVDGTNFQSVAPFIQLTKLTGTNLVRWYTNIASSAISGAAAVRLESYGNADTNPVTFTVRFSRAKKPVAPPGLSTITTGFQ